MTKATSGSSFEKGVTLEEIRDTGIHEPPMSSTDCVNVEPDASTASTSPRTKAHFRTTIATITDTRAIKAESARTLLTSGYVTRRLEFREV